MAYNQYSGYGGNPYGSSNNETPRRPSTDNPYGGNSYSNEVGNPGPETPYGMQHDGNAVANPAYSNPYAGGGAYERHGDGNTYTRNQQNPVIQPATSNYGASPYGQSYSNEPAAAPPMPEGHVEYVQAGPTVLSNQDFLSRVEAVKADIRTLTTQVGQIASAHQRTLSSPDNSSSAQLESLISQTQVLNTSIKDQIKFLETDAARSRGNQVKDTQIRQLKTSFQKQVQEYRQEEANYEKRYREQIARQYRIVNPEASESEVQEAADADWGNEGVFQTALKSNRSATANTVLGAVRARHNDIQKIERTLIELNALMEDLATTIVLQEQPIQQTEQHTENVKKDTEAGNQQLDKGIEHARRARRLKWICLAIVVAIVIILALVLGLFFALPHLKDLARQWFEACGENCDNWGFVNWDSNNTFPGGPKKWLGLAEEGGGGNGAGARPLPTQAP